MWRMHDGDRVLTDAEWGVFGAGLDRLWWQVEFDIESGRPITYTGVTAFDRLTSEQKLGLLAEVASAVRDPAVPTPQHTAANEATVAAVFESVRGGLHGEVDGVEGTELRRAVLAAVADPRGRRRLPKPTSARLGVWDNLVRELVERVLWDYDFEMEEYFLDQPPETARMLMDLSRIDPDYFLYSPPEPNEQEMEAARQTMATLLDGRT